MHELIPVNSATIGGIQVQAVDGRLLHNFLEVGRDFTNWIKSRVVDYGFALGVDFEVFANSGENLGGRARTDYTLTLDMAKELAMVERNEKGRQARRYFIECERRLRAQPRRFSEGAEEALTAMQDRLDSARHQVDRYGAELIELYETLIAQRVPGRFIGLPLSKAVRAALLERGGILDMEDLTDILYHGGLRLGPSPSHNVTMSLTRPTVRPLFSITTTREGRQLVTLLTHHTPRQL